MHLKFKIPAIIAAVMFVSAVQLIQSKEIPMTKWKIEPSFKYD